MPKRQQNKIVDIFNRISFKPLPKLKAGPEAPPEYHDHTLENGRRYRGHRDEYLWPNDDEATKSYSSLNTVWTFLLRPEGDLQRANYGRQGQGRSLKVLDYGARGMSWMSKVKDRYPDVRITVVDPGCRGCT